MKRLVFIGLILVGCSSNDPFCDCLKAGEELNEFSSTLFEGELTTEDASKMADLREKKDGLCEKYETMGGQELMELQEKCK